SAGVMHIDPGQRLGEHTHRRHHHHVWVVSGRTRVLGQELGAGSYAHIPSGVAHDFEALGASGCTVFYLYQEDPGGAAG
ncbi:MAG TPA: cupin domain-containing protein, partial [Acidimicrobiales bacterium]|nr:cupin domain-containing protein [Acidimicrobiales bacterium]